MYNNVFILQIQNRKQVNRYKTLKEKMDHKECSEIVDDELFKFLLNWHVSVIDDIT
jgi:hypothetical protein